MYPCQLDNLERMPAMKFFPLPQSEYTMYLSTRPYTCSNFFNPYPNVRTLFIPNIINYTTTK